MPKLFAIVRREFIERVRTKAFLIGTIVGPLLFFAFSKVPEMLFSGSEGTQTIAVLDASSGGAGGRLLDSLSRETIGPDSAHTPRYHFQMLPVEVARVAAVRDSLIPQIDRRDAKGNALPDALTGVLVVTDSGLAAGELTYLGRNVGSLGDINHLEGGLRRQIVRERLRALGASESLATAATSPVDLKTSKVTKGQLTGEGAASAFLLSYILVIILFIAMMPTGVQVMSAVVEEKTNRILEVLVSSVRPIDLMLGKIIGVGGAVLLQLGIWAGSASLLGTMSARAQMVGGAAGGAGAGGGSGFTMPSIPTDLIVVTLIYFALGFLFFSSAYAAVGAMCNTVQETQQMQFPVMGMVFAGYLGAFATIGRPEGIGAKVMSYIPFTAPFIVPTRWSSSSLPLSELLTSMAVCALGVFGMVWLAARIYRVGILSYGKKPSFKDIWVWIRTT